MQGGTRHDPDSPRPGAARLLRGLYSVAIVLAVVLAGVYLSGLTLLVERASLGALVMGLVLGVLSADLVTALVHWACDTWGCEETRWFGPGLIRAFREHHREPEAMLRHDWIEVNGEAGLGASVAFLVFGPLAWELIRADQLFWYVFLWALIGFASLANQLHKWAHVDNPPPVLRRLQKMGFVLSHERHARHHRAPHTTGYCISTGWLNGFLDTTRFWRALELLVTFATGAQARATSRHGGRGTQTEFRRGTGS